MLKEHQPNLQKAFTSPRGAMTNTLRRLEMLLGMYTFVLIGTMPVRKRVAISSIGAEWRATMLFLRLHHVLNEVVSDLGKDHLKQTLPILRGLKSKIRAIAFYFACFNCRSTFFLLFGFAK